MEEAWWKADAGWVARLRRAGEQSSPLQVRRIPLRIRPATTTQPGWIVVYNPGEVVALLASDGAGERAAKGRASNPEALIFGQASQGQLDELGRLADGGSVRKTLDLTLSLTDPKDDPESLWPLLYQAGYLTTQDTDFENDRDRLRTIYCPNQTARKALRRALEANDRHNKLEEMRRLAAEAGMYDFDYVDQMFEYFGVE